MASPITAGTGLGSGLNIGDIVKVLVDSDKAAKQNQISKQTDKTTASLSAVAKLQSALTAFQDAMKSLNSTTTPAFLGFAASSSAETTAKATATNTAVNGTYSLVVKQLATGSKVATASIDPASAIPSGNLKITQNGIDYDVALTGGTLEETRNAINTSLQGKGISANIINDANGARLVFTSTTTGAGKDLKVVGDASVGTMLDIDGTKTMASTAVGGVPGAGAIAGFAQDAKFTIDGLELTSAKNKVEGAISGLTLDLVSGGDGVNASTFKSSTITVATNTDGLRTSLQTFVSSYNTLVNLVTTLTKGSTDAKGVFTPAELTGDSAPRNMLAAIRSEIATSTSSSGLGSLAQLGITTQGNGTLLLDNVKFTAAMDDKKLGGQIQSLFSGDTGLLARITKSITPFSETGGILAQKTTQLNKTNAQLAEQQEALDRRIETLTAALTKKYNAMDLVVGQLKATASSITSIFEAMNAQKNAS